MMNEQIPAAFAALWQAADRQRREMTERQEICRDVQFIAMRTANGQLAVFANDIRTDADEARMLQDMARNGVQVEKMVCVWSTGELDVPSHRFRKGLLEIDPANRSAQMLLTGEHGFSVRTLEASM